MDHEGEGHKSLVDVAEWKSGELRRFSFCDNEKYFAIADSDFIELKRAGSWKQAFRALSM